MYEERLAGDFSTQHFQALKAKACAVGSGASGVMGVWNAAWLQCQEVRQCLDELHTKKNKKKNGVDKNQTQHPATPSPQGKAGGMEKEEERGEVGEDECSLTQPSSPKETVSGRERSTAISLNDVKEQTQDLKSHKEQRDNEEICPVFPPSHCDPVSKSKQREHHSEADLRTDSKAADEFPSHKALGRSLSEGSCVSSHLGSLISGFAPLNVRHKHCQSRTQPLEQHLQLIQNAPTSHNNVLQQGNLSLESESNEEKGRGCTASTQSPEDSRTPETLLTPTEDNGTNVL